MPEDVPEAPRGDYFCHTRYVKETDPTLKKAYCWGLLPVDLRCGQYTCDDEAILPTRDSGSKGDQDPPLLTITNFNVEGCPEQDSRGENSAVEC